MEPPASTARHVGIFDSGIGGLSVLRGLRQVVPACDLSYLADNRHLPYGDKSPAWLMARATQLSAHLLARGAELILVACNTATTHTMAALRAQWPHVPFVGVEPGIKPAAASSSTRRIAVMATPATLRSERLQNLIAQHAADCDVHLLSCPELAGAIEQDDDLPLEQAIGLACHEIERRRIDTVVLGCTHYPLIADRLAARLGNAVQWIDTADAVSRRVVALLGPAPLSAGAARLCVYATGDVAPIQRAVRRWIDTDAEVLSCPI